MTENKEIFASVISMLVYAVGGLDVYLNTLIIEKTEYFGIKIPSVFIN